jgi:DnaJ family protein C protein 28
MAAGAFDRLPGQGKPLDLARNPYLDPSQELAFGLLKNNGYAPEWISRDKQIREELAEARARLRATWAQRQSNPAYEADWQTSVARFEHTLSQLNGRIDDLNLVVPIPSCQRVHLRLADELRRLDHE